MVQLNSINLFIFIIIWDMKVTILWYAHRQENKKKEYVLDYRLVGWGIPLAWRILSMSFSPMIPEPDKLNGLLTRLMLPEALIMAIRSLPPVKPRVQFLTREYFLHFQWKWELLYEIGRHFQLARDDISRNDSKPRERSLQEEKKMVVLLKRNIRTTMCTS